MDWRAHKEGALGVLGSKIRAWSLTSWFSMQSYCFLLSLTTEDEIFYLKLWCRFRLDPGHFVKWETEPKMLTDLPKSVQITLESRVNSMDISELKIINLSTPVDFSSLEGNPYLELPYWCPVLGETVLDKGPRIVPGLSCPLATTLISLPSHLRGNHDSELGFLPGKVKGRVFQHFSSPNCKNILTTSLFTLQKGQPSGNFKERASSVEENPTKIL